MNPRPELRIHYLEGAGLMRSRVAHVVVLVLVGAFLLAAGAPASNPPTGSLTVPATAGGTASHSWTGTIPPGTNPTSDCNGGTSVPDQHVIHITAPTSYAGINAQF